MHWILSDSGSLVSPIKQEASTLIVFPADKKKKKNTLWFLCQGNPHKLGWVCKHLSSRREAEPHGRDTVRRCVLGWGRLGKARGAHAPVTPVPLVTVLGWNPGWGGRTKPTFPAEQGPSRPAALPPHPPPGSSHLPASSPLRTHKTCSQTGFLQKEPVFQPKYFQKETPSEGGTSYLGHDTFKNTY